MQLALSGINGNLLGQMVLQATDLLEQHKEIINALNVFPVPDGDTGSNMALTMHSASREVKGSRGDGVGQIAQAAAHGSLMGARGNSGVILSQLFRGFAHHAQDRQQLNAADLALCLQAGVDTAYKAVMRPVEGTILTVARAAAAAASKESRRGAGIINTLAAAHTAALAALVQTPELLAVLKKAGVVDAGGQGYCYVLSGYLAAARLAADGNGGLPPSPAPPEIHPPSPPTSAGLSVINDELAEIPLPYDTELFIRGPEIPLDAVRTRLDALGDSVYVVGSAQLAKVHIHTDNPGPVLTLCLEYGELINIQIENMRQQYANLKQGLPGQAAPEAAPGQVAPGAALPAAVVAVVPGPGLEAITRSLGAAYTIIGGQTMNPSTEDILAAIAAAPADHIFVLPNNSNIVLAARQAAGLSNKHVRVIPSRSVPQGIAALMLWQPSADLDRLGRSMEQALASVETGEITYAVRDAVIGGLTVNTGDILGLWNGEVVAAGTGPEIILKRVLGEMVDQAGGEMITIYYGQDVTGEQAAALGAELRNLYPDHEVEVQFGGQPLYFYIFSLE